MPYARLADLPASVRARYSERCQRVFRTVVNAALGVYRDEGRAMATAHAAARRCEMTGKAEMTAAAMSDLPDRAFACIDPGGHRDESGRTVPRSLRHYPHHTASGALDLPHLRNALARIAQPGTADCGQAHLEAHAQTAGIGTR